MAGSRRSSRSGRYHPARCLPSWASHGQTSATVPSTVNARFITTSAGYTIPSPGRGAAFSSGVAATTLMAFMRRGRRVGRCSAQGGLRRSVGPVRRAGGSGGWPSWRRWRLGHAAERSSRRGVRRRGRGCCRTRSRQPQPLAARVHNPTCNGRCRRRRSGTRARPPARPDGRCSPSAGAGALTSWLISTCPEALGPP